METITLEKEQANIMRILSTVCDPEIPVLSITDLGIIRKVEYSDDDCNVYITPTYSGCPAMDMITVNIKVALQTHGYRNVKVHQVLSPAWTTDWMTDEGKMKLKAYGIAPPNPSQQVCNSKLFAPDEAIECPKCGSYHTSRVSEFGSTACKSLYSCNDCKEPFDYFKCH